MIMGNDSTATRRLCCGDMALAYLEIEEVIAKAEDGATQPFLCRASDDDLYVVKGRAALPSGLISEVVCAALARDFGLPVPDFAIVALDARLNRFNAQAASSLGEGWGFASKYNDSLTPAGRSNLGRYSKALLKDVFIFDHWIKNEDRTGTFWGGNPNMFIDVVDKRLVILDHNLAFDRSFNQGNFNELHICRDFWFGSEGMLERELYQPRLEALIGLADTTVRALPEEWIGADPTVVPHLLGTLQAVTEEAFWGAIR